MLSLLAPAAWMAPETMGGVAPTRASTVYSLGIVLNELTSGKLPFGVCMDEVVSYAVCLDKKRPIIADSCPLKLKKLIEKCWDQDPLVRPTAQSILDELQQI